MSNGKSILGQILRASWKLFLLMLWTMFRLTEVTAAAFGNLVKALIK